jgi:hypothetical protein
VVIGVKLETVTVTPDVLAPDNMTPVVGVIDHVRAPVPVAVWVTENVPPFVNVFVPGFAKAGVFKLLVRLNDWTHEDGVGFVAVSVYVEVAIGVVPETFTVTPDVLAPERVTAVVGLIVHVSGPVFVAVCVTENEPPAVKVCVPGFANAGETKVF